VDTPKTITHISLCAGYGGIDIGLKRCLPTLRTILVSEIEAYAVANLVAKMEAGQMDPAPIWTDLKTLPWDCVPKGVSILSGGFPCQPFSAAGNREGDEDPRHLFPYIKNAIRTIQPRLVFLENVEGIISAKLKGDGWEDPAGTPVLLHVLRELERVGYDSTAGVFSAAEVGAPHQRKRVFVLGKKLADPGSEGREGQVRQGKAGEEGSPHRHSAECGGSVADPNSSRGFKDWIASQLRSSGIEQSSGNRWPSRPGEAQQEWEEPRVVGDSKTTELADTSSERNRESKQGVPKPNQCIQGRKEGSTHAGGCVQTELADTGHPESSGRDGETEGQLRESRGKSAPQDCGDEQAEHEAQPVMGGATPGSTSGVDSTANRVDRLRLLGNGVVPDTCEIAFRTLYKELCEKD
jgi:DNA (cytosine-5)-methyltransferase 1